MLSEVIQVAIWIDHIKDHGLALFWDHVHASSSFGISPAREGCLAPLHPLIEVDAKVDGT